jgi:hypothetical protein
MLEVFLLVGTNILRNLPIKAADLSETGQKSVI